jgi:ribosomal protein S18 acetylase RimI-like enzyme
MSHDSTKPIAEDHCVDDSINFRRAQPEDFEAVLELASQLAVHIKSDVPKLTRERYLACHIGDRAPMHLLLACRGKRVLGMISWILTHELYSGDARVYISDLSVDGSVRNRGVGNALMAQVIAWARAHGAQKIAWEIWHKNFIAKTFYEKLGAVADDEAVPYLLVLKDDVLAFMTQKSWRFRPSTLEDVEPMFDVWRASVIATHDFVTEADFAEICIQVRRDYLPNYPLIVAVDGDDRVVGFMGLNGVEIDSLFIDPSARGQGLGRAFVAEAIAAAQTSELEVEVNEQNKQAVGFYEAMGFATISSSPLDAHGRPYPLLRMRRGATAVAETSSDASGNVC